VSPAPPSATGPPWASDRRPSWLLPAIAVAFVVAAAIVAVVVVRSRDSAPGSFTGKANELIAPVSASDRLLDTRLRSVAGISELGDVAAAASQLTRDLTLAEGGLNVLDVRNDEQRAKALLGQALAANLGYAEQVRTAAASLDLARASAAASAGRQAAQSYSAAGAGAPKLALPPAAVFGSASSLEALAADQAKEEQTKASADAARAASAAAVRTYVRSIDSLLRTSAQTRRDLATLITATRNGRVSAARATSEIASIISQRQGLQNQVSTVPAPPGFRGAAARLRGSIDASLNDDYAIQGWISAWFAGDSAAFERAFARHEAATARASAAKGRFLALYNRLRSRLLNLTPLNVSY
jgi:hypothetical protein